MLIALVAALTLAIGLDGTALAGYDIIKGPDIEIKVGDIFQSSDTIHFNHFCELYYNNTEYYNNNGSYYVNFEKDLGVPANSSVRVTNVNTEIYTYGGMSQLCYFSITFEDNQSPNPITYGNQSVSKTFSTSAQTANLNGASNAQGNVTYSITSQKQGNTDVSYFSLSGTTLKINASTPAGTYTVKVKAHADGNTNYKPGDAESTVTITINKAANPLSFTGTQSYTKTYSGSAQSQNLKAATNGQGNVTYAITSQKKGSTNVSYFSLSGTTLNIAAKNFAEAHGLCGTAGSDAHDTSELGSMCLELPDFNNADELRESIKTAKVVGKESPQWVRYYSRKAVLFKAVNRIFHVKLYRD